jgi:hypothetical protein
MIRRVAATGVLLSATALLAAAAVPPAADPVPLTVHEWGTFTSIAGPDGAAQIWRPLAGAQDLPCFVDRIRFGIKPDLSGTVRMETPVLYFYAPHRATLDVSVGFRQGFLTEWFPRATVTPGTVYANAVRDPNLVSRITWKNVEVSPQLAADFPTEPQPSHYYAARATDALPVRVGSQKERFLFYRGVGQFPPPLTARLQDGRIRVANRDDEPLGTLVLFENRAGTIGYRVAPVSESKASLDATVPPGSLSSLRQELEQILAAEGLYAREAAAMVETWRDSWFEEGTRIFYVPSKRAIDAILPLEINPTPVDVARVFVGRLELVTPWMVEDVTKAVAAADARVVRKYGRFLAPIAAQIAAGMPSAERARWDARVNAALAGYYSALPAAVGCR